jgi:hypothetical protein
VAQSFDAGHEETQRSLPGLIQSGWYPGIWALPATTLSMASSLVFAIVLAFLLAGETSRALFRLPMAAAWALAAALLAWIVAVGCRNRPGRQLPRVWLIILSAGTTILAAVCFVGGEAALSPLVQASVLASLAATVTLLPRLLHLQPADRLVQHIAPLALAFVLLVTLPVSFYIGRRAVKDQQRRVEATVVELAREAGEVRAASTFTGSNGAERQEDVLRQVEQLRNLPIERWLPDRYLWQGAARLGEDGRLATAYRDLLDAVVTGIDPAHAPTLCHPQFNGSNRGWSRDPRFPDLSAAVAGYHLRTGQILQHLAPPAGESQALRDLGTYYDQKAREVESHLAAMAKTWNEDWVPSLLAARGPDPGSSLSPLVELLRRPLPPDGSLRPASLERLLALKLGQAQRMADPRHGCADRSYREGDLQYFRIDCYAYAARPAANPPSADLRVEMRIVYKWQEQRSLRRSDLPAEIYFLFPVPPGTDPAKYRDDVMLALETAVGAEHQASTPTRDGRSSLTGFSIKAGLRHRLLEVTSHRIKDMSGQSTDASGGVPGIGVRAQYVVGRSRPVARS